MGVEGRDKAKALEAGAASVSTQLGRSVQRLRKSYSLSLSELSEQSGVAKSIISQIERNETNPTLATLTCRSSAYCRRPRTSLSWTRPAAATPPS